MEGQKTNLAIQFSSITALYYMTMFFLPIFPIGSAILSLNLVLFYWVQKFFFVSIYKKPREIGRGLAMENLSNVKHGATLLLLGIIVSEYFMGTLGGHFTFYIMIGVYISGLVIGDLLERRYVDMGIRKDTDNNIGGKIDDSHADKPYS